MVRSQFAARISLSCLLAASTALATIASSPAAAQATNQSASQATRDFDIPALPLSQALRLFMRQSGVQVSYDSETASRARTSAVKGRMATAEALGRMLAGSGLTYRFTAPTSAVLEPVPQASADTVQLGTLRVEGGGQGGGRAFGAGGEAGDPRAASDAPYRTPGSNAHITREEIDRVPPTTTGDIFRLTPGVASGSNYNGTAIDVNIRGAQGMDRVKVLVDGTEQTNAIYRGYDGPDNRSYVDAELIGGVDIEKGPGAGSRSAGAIGGVVSIRTLNVDDLVKPGDRFGGRLRGLLGDNRITPHEGAKANGGSSFISAPNWLGSLAAGFRGEKLDLVAAYSHRQTGNYFAGNKHGDLTYKRRLMYSLNYEVTEDTRYSPINPGEEVWNTSENTESGLLKAKYRFSDELNLEAGAVYYASDYGMTYPLWMLPYWYKQFGLSEVESQRYYSTLRWGPSNDLVNLYANIWYTKVDSVDAPFTDTEPGASTNSHAGGINVSNDSALVTPFGEGTLKIGGEYSSNDNQRFIFYTLPKDDLYRTMKGRRTVGGLFAKLDLSPTPWLAVSAGLRYDWYRNRGTTTILSFPIDPVTGQPGRVISYEDRKLSASSFSPSGAITVTPWDGVQLFVQYSRGWRPPSLFEITGPGMVIRLDMNPNLRPERSDSVEIGANLLRKGIFQSDDTLRGKVVYFMNDYKDYIIRSGYRPTPTEDAYRFDNLEGASFHGIEASLGYDSGNIFTSAQVTYYTRVQYCFDVPESWQDPAFGYGAAKGCFNEAPLTSWPGANNPAKYSGSATLGTRLLEGRLTLGGRWTFYGVPATRLSPANTGSLQKRWAATQTYDLFAGYRVNDALRLDLSIENITDRYFLAPHTVAQIPGPGRQAKFSFTFKF